jgi:hypothetical protein
MNQRLQHDTAFALAHVLLGIVQNCIRKDERRDAFDAFYDACRAGIEAYEVQVDRMQQRMKPLEN